MKPTANNKSSGAIRDIFHMDEATTEARGLTELIPPYLRDAFIAPFP